MWMSPLALASAAGAAPSGGGSSDYDIDDALDGIPYVGFTQPTAPNITNGSATVSTATFDANNTGGKILTLQAGSYGNKTLASDMRYLLQDGAILGDYDGGADRIEIGMAPGQTARGGTIGTALTFSGTDFFANSVTIDGSDNDNIFSGSRCVLLNCQIRMVGYCVYLHELAGTDFLVANCDMESSTGSGGVIRCMGWSRVGVVDNRTRNLGAGQGIRFHATDTAATNIYCARNQIERGIGFISTTGSASVGAVWYHDNVLYHEQSTGNYGTVNGTAVEFRRNTMHSSGGAFPSSGGGIDVDGSNTIVEANTSAPAWSYRTG